MIIAPASIFHTRKMFSGQKQHENFCPIEIYIH